MCDTDYSFSTFTKGYLTCHECGTLQTTTRGQAFFITLYNLIGGEHVDPPLAMKGANWLVEPCK